MADGMYDEEELNFECQLTKSFCYGITVHLHDILFTVTMQGNASGGERAQHVGAQANKLIEFAMTYIAQNSVLPEYPPSGNSHSAFLFDLEFIISTHQQDYIFRKYTFI